MPTKVEINISGLFFYIAPSPLTLSPLELNACGYAKQ